MRKSTLSLSCFSLIAIATSSWLWSQWRLALAENLQLQDRVSSLESLALKAPSIDAPPPAAELPTVRAPAAAIDAHPATTAVLSQPNFPGALQSRLMTNPEFRRALRNQQRQVIEAEFRDLPRLLGLSPDQANQLFDLMAEQGVKILEAQWRRPEEGKSRQTYREVRSQNEAELTEFLGPSNMSRLQEFRSTLQSRSEVDSVRNELARSSEPMREDQVEPMIAIVNSELQTMKQELMAAGVAEFGGISGDPIADSRRSEAAIAANQRIAKAARTILSGTQLAALEDLYRHQRLQMEAQGEMSRLRTEAMLSAAPGLAPPN